MMKSHRLDRVGAQIRRELSEMLRRERQPGGNSIITVTEVRVSRDLKYADIWVSAFGIEPEAMLKRLKENSGRLRHTLAGRVRIHRIPELRFKHDPTLDVAERIEHILNREGFTAFSDDDDNDGGDEKQD